MASRSVLLGKVPPWSVTPPSMLRTSMMATDFPSLAAAMAPFWPAGPLPMTARSKDCVGLAEIVTGGDCDKSMGKGGIGATSLYRKLGDAPSEEASEEAREEPEPRETESA